MNVFLIGFMGCGKSYVGKKLAQQLHYSFIDLDDYLEQQEQTTISNIFATKGEMYFRNAEQKYLKQLTSLTQTVIATGGGTPCFFDNINWINQHGISIYLKATMSVLVHRLQPEIAHRPLLVGKSTMELSQFIQSKLSKRSIFYEQANHIINITTPNQVVTPQIINFIQNRN